MTAYRLEDALHHTVVIKDEQRFWKRILIVDDDADVTVTFKAGIEDNNNDPNTRIDLVCNLLQNSIVLVSLSNDILKPPKT